MIKTVPLQNEIINYLAFAQFLEDIDFKNKWSKIIIKFIKDIGGHLKSWIEFCIKNRVIEQNFVSLCDIPSIKNVTHVSTVKMLLVKMLHHGLLINNRC